MSCKPSHRGRKKFKDPYRAGGLKMDVLEIFVLLVIGLYFGSLIFFEFKQHEKKMEELDLKIAKASTELDEVRKK